MNLDPQMARPRTKAAVVEAYRHDTISAAAIRAIARKGASAMRVQDVADEAGVSKGTIYLYFRGREELRAAAGNQTMETLLGELEAMAGANAALDDLLMRIVSRALERLDARDDVILAALAFAREPHGVFVTFRAHWSARVAGLLPVRDPATSVPLILDCLRGVLERRLCRLAASDRDELAAATVSVLLHGVAEKDAAP